MNILATSEVLNRAADLIEERGWAQGGGWFYGGDEYATSPLCLEGGIMAALGLHFDTGETDDFEECPAYVAVRSYLGAACRNAVLGVEDARLWAWNDTVAESGEQVIATLRAVAVIEAAREQEMAEVSR